MSSVDSGVVADHGSLAGIGIGWRPEISGFVESLSHIGFVEVVAEAISHRLPDSLVRLIDRGVPIVTHGTRVSIGSADALEPQRVSQFVEAAALAGAPLVSEHIAFVRAGGVEAGHLLPLPRTKEAVAAVTRNVAVLQQELSVPLALEPIAAIFDWPEAELTEAQFLTEILDRTGCSLLLDVANVYANAINRGEEPTALLDELPLERIAYVHMAGGSEGRDAEGNPDGIYHDTHTDAVPPEVMSLLVELTERRRPPGVMLERDGYYPPADELRAELNALADASGHPRVS